MQDQRAAAARHRHRSEVRLGRRPGADRDRWHDAVIYEAHVKGLTQRHPDVPQELRGTYAGVAHPADRSATSRSSASPPSSCCRSTASSTTSSCSTGACATTGATTRSRSSRRTARYSRRRSRASEVARVQGDGQGAPRGRHRGHPRRRLQPHRRGQPPRPDALASRASTTARYYRLVADDPRYYFDYTGTGNTLNVRHPQVLQLIMDSLRYWVEEMHVDGFRFDLASTLARELHEVDRLSQLLRHHPPGSGAQPREADRRAVGRRRGRLPGRQLPARWAEWNGKYRDAIRAFWRGDGGNAGELGYRLDRHRATCTSTTARAPYASDQLHHRARRLHAARSRLVQRASTTRRTARTTATATTTTTRGTAASRARPTTPRSSSCARASSATSWRRCCSRRACR